MLRKIVENIESLIERKNANKANKKGLNGIGEGYEANMADVCNLAKKAWEMVSQHSIAKCWKRAHCLPCGMEADITQIFGRTTNRDADDNVNEVANLFEKLGINVGETENEHSAEELFNEWVDLEYSEEARFALACSLVDDLDDEVEEDNQ